VTPDVSAATFGPKLFAGVRLYAEVNTFDSPTLPRRGVALHASVEGRYDVLHGNSFSANHRLAAAVAIPLERTGRFVITSRLGLEGITGSFPFYFAPTLGANNYLRAYAQQQLAGDFILGQATDLRIDVLRLRTVLPGTIGVNVSLDHGRVWGQGVEGNDWHFNLGGGVWWAVVDLFGVYLSYHRGLEGGDRVVFALGPLFSNTGF
jgi:hypothetical protein